MKDFTDKPTPSLIDIILKAIQRQDNRLNCDRVFTFKGQFHYFTSLVTLGTVEKKLILYNNNNNMLVCATINHCP